MLACNLLAASCEGQEITSVEGVSEHGSLAAIQKAYGDWGGSQCGFCTPGFMMTVKHLLAVNPDPERKRIRGALSRNLCRCTGYSQMYQAINAAIEAEQKGMAAAKGNDQEPTTTEASPSSVNRQRWWMRPGRPPARGSTHDDLSLPGMLIGKILHSPYPHARMKRIDTSRAEKLEGVVAVVTGKDAPNAYGILPVGHDEHCAWPRTRFAMWETT